MDETKRFGVLIFVSTFLTYTFQTFAMNVELEKLETAYKQEIEAIKKQKSFYDEFIVILNHFNCNQNYWFNDILSLDEKNLNTQIKINNFIKLIEFALFEIDIRFFLFKLNATKTFDEWSIFRDKTAKVVLNDIRELYKNSSIFDSKKVIDIVLKYLDLKSNDLYAKTYLDREMSYEPIFIHQYLCSRASCEPIFDRYESIFLDRIKNIDSPEFAIWPIANLNQVIQCPKIKKNNKMLIIDHLTTLIEITHKLKVWYKTIDGQKYLFGEVEKIKTESDKNIDDNKLDLAEDGIKKILCYDAPNRIKAIGDMLNKAFNKNMFDFVDNVVAYSLLNSSEKPLQKMGIKCLTEMASEIKFDLNSGKSLQVAAANYPDNEYIKDLLKKVNKNISDMHKRCLCIVLDPVGTPNEVKLAKNGNIASTTFEVIDAIENGIPLLTNKYTFGYLWILASNTNANGQRARLIFKKLEYECSVFISSYQEGFCLILPTKDANLAEFGFNKNYLNKLSPIQIMQFSKKSSSFLYRFFTGLYPEIREELGLGAFCLNNLLNLFLQQDISLEFDRTIFLGGHGDLGDVAGFSLDDLVNLLLFFNKKEQRTSLFIISSCQAGGTNMLKIQQSLADKINNLGSKKLNFLLSKKHEVLQGKIERLEDSKIRLESSQALIDTQQISEGLEKQLNTAIAQLNQEIAQLSKQLNEEEKKLDIDRDKFIIKFPIVIRGFIESSNFSFHGSKSKTLRLITKFFSYDASVTPANAPTKQATFRFYGKSPKLKPEQNVITLAQSFAPLYNEFMANFVVVRFPGDHSHFRPLYELDKNVFSLTTIALRALRIRLEYTKGQLKFETLPQPVFSAKKDLSALVIYPSNLSDILFEFSTQPLPKFISAMSRPSQHYIGKIKIPKDIKLLDSIKQLFLKPMYMICYDMQPKLWAIEQVINSAGVVLAEKLVIYIEGLEDGGGQAIISYELNNENYSVSLPLTVKNIKAETVFTRARLDMAKFFQKTIPSDAALREATDQVESLTTIKEMLSNWGFGDEILSKWLPGKK